MHVLIVTALPVYLLALLALFKVLIILSGPRFELSFDTTFVYGDEFSITMDTTSEWFKLSGQIKSGNDFLKLFLRLSMMYVMSMVNDTTF